MMKNILLITLFMITVNYGQNAAAPDTGSSLSYGTKSQPITEGRLTIYKLEDFSTFIIKIPEISDYIFNAKPAKTFSETAAENDFELVVNASYFDRDSTGYRHAGYLRINGNEIAPYKKDRQLSGVLAYENGRADYLPLSGIETNKSAQYLIQTGPQIIRDNKICEAEIDSSINGGRNDLRTAIGSVDNKELYIIITKKGVPLKKLGELLLNSGIFIGRLDVINLDGGSSTALYIKNHPELSFRPSKKLPFLIGVK